MMHGHDVCSVCVACEYMGYMCVMCICFVLVACTISKNIPLAQISSITLLTFFYVLNKYSVIKCALDVKITRKKINIDYQSRLKCHGKISGLILKQTLWDRVVTVHISQSYQAQTKPRGKHHYEKKQSKVIKLHRPLSTCMLLGIYTSIAFC